MKQYIKPKITLVSNEVIMAVKCNERFIYTSAGGVQSNGFAKVCYHYRRKRGSYEWYDRYTAVVIDIPPGAIFEVPDVDGAEGWQDFEGTNGTCHFIGDIYVNGTLITPSNAGNYAPSE